MPIIKSGIRLNKVIVKRLFSFGIWVNIASLVVPIILFADRFMIATIFSIEAVTYYTVPYEVVTKLWIFSASLLGVLFPVFSSTSDKSKITEMSKNAFIVLTIIVVPLSGMIIIFGSDFLSFWINPHFSMMSGSVMKWLALGVLVNVLAQIPLTALQAVGHPATVSKIQIIELPFYLLLMFFLANKFGSVGIAMAWTARSFIDAILLQAAASKKIGFSWINKYKNSLIFTIISCILFLVSLWLIEKYYRDIFYLKLLLYLVVNFIFVFTSYKVFVNYKKLLFIKN